MIRRFGRTYCLHIEVTEFFEVDADCVTITVLGKLQLRQARTEGETVLS